MQKYAIKYYQIDSTIYQKDQVGFILGILGSTCNNQSLQFTQSTDLKRKKPT